MKNKNGKKNILLVHNYYKIPGGEDTVVQNEKELLESHGHRVIFYSRKNAEMDGFSKLQKLLLPIITVFNPRSYKEIKSIIKKEKIDIVHVHNTLNLISPSVYYAAKSCRVPVVQTIHNFRMLCPAATFYRDGKICEECVEKGLYCAVKHKCYRDSRLQTLACVITTKIHRMTGIYKKLSYICLAEFNKEKLLQINHTEKKAIIQPKNVFVKPNLTFRQLEKVQSSEGNYYLFAGRVEKIKGIELLLDAFEKLPNEKLLIAGTGTQLEYYKELAAKRGLAGIEFLGFLGKEQLQEKMAGAKALIVPSQWYETFGMTVVEAFSLGTPVIASDIGNLSSLIKEGINGWKFTYDSVEELVEKVTVCSGTSKENLQVACDDAIFPEKNYEILNHIYETVINNKL